MHYFHALLFIRVLNIFRIIINIIFVIFSVCFMIDNIEKLIYEIDDIDIIRRKHNSIFAIRIQI